MPPTASLDQVSAKEYLQLNVFPKLESALNTVSKTLINQKMNEKSNWYDFWLWQLLETIEKNGEFERYVVMLTDREEKEHRELRRRERER